jgi:DUF1365 family protein
MTASALYMGVVTHRRVRPVLHSLRYRVFMLLLDLDEAPALTRGLRFFGVDRRRLAAFRQRDHGAGAAAGLRDWVEGYLHQAGLPAGGAIRVLCMPRVLGFAFNPLTVCFCYAPAGNLQAVLYEVNNTFGQRHGYLLPVEGRGDLVQQDCAKAFHVSPFLDMALRYRFRIVPPGEDVSVGIQVVDEKGVVLAASFSGARRALTDRAVLGAVLAMPLQGAAVLLGIHWEALKLWLKGMRLRPEPPMPAVAVTVKPVAGQVAS